MLAFISISYHLYDGKPYHCTDLVNYNKDFSWLLLGISAAIISLLTFIEHIYWRPNNNQIQPTTRQSSPSNQTLIEINPLSGNSSAN